MRRRQIEHAKYEALKSAARAGAVEPHNGKFVVYLNQGVTREDVVEGLVNIHMNHYFPKKRGGRPKGSKNKPK